MLCHFIFSDNNSGRFSGIPIPTRPYKTPVSVHVKPKRNMFFTAVLLRIFAMLVCIIKILLCEDIVWFFSNQFDHWQLCHRDYFSREHTLGNTTLKYLLASNLEWPEFWDLWKTFAVFLEKHIFQKPVRFLPQSYKANPFKPLLKLLYMETLLFAYEAIISSSLSLNRSAVCPLSGDESWKV